MPESLQQDKAALFRRLHQGETILVLPNAWDVASARIFEQAGFAAVATTSAGLANMLGYPDGEFAPREEVLFMVSRIARSLRAPVTADVEAGYGVNSVEEVVRTARGVWQAGAVGINLEDSGGDVQGDLVDVGLQCEKIQAIRALATSEGIEIVVNARTDAFHLAKLGPAERHALAVERANAYRKAGADCLFVPFVTEAPIIGALVREIDGPLNVLAMPGTPPVDELQRLGVARVSIGSGAHRATLALIERIATELRETGTYRSFMEQTMPYPTANALFVRA